MFKSSKNSQKTNQRRKDENDDQESIDTQTDGQYDNKHDLCKSIPGLYRLLDVFKDESSNGLVDKIIISNKYMKELCNEIVPNSYRSISKIRFEQLNYHQILLIGCYGKNELIAKFLLQKGLIDQSAYESLLIPYNYNSINEKHIISGLRPGIYLKKLSSDDDEIPKFMVLHWSEDSCYKGSASSFLKKNMTNFHRYLTKITSHQLCLMDDDDLENFDWQVFKVIEDDDDEAADSGDDSICHTFEVKKSQEQKENFEFSPGFNISFQKLAQISECNDGPPLHPLVIESVSNQTFLTREMIPAKKTIEKNILSFDSFSKFRDYFRQKLDVQKCSLKFDRNLMTIEKLEIIVKDGLLLPELFRPYSEALKSHENKRIIMKQDNKNKVDRDITIMKQMTLQHLKKTYSNFEDKIDKIIDKTVDNDEINRVKQTYPNVCEKLLALVESITLESWNDNKNRFIFAKKYADNSGGKNQDNVAKENISAHKIFFDDERDFVALVRKYTSETTWYSNLFGISSNAKDIVNKIREASKKIPDGEFVRQISDYGDEKIAARFFEKYKDWKKHKFHESLNQIIRAFERNTEWTLSQKNESELSGERWEIKRKHFNEICDNLELKYPEGDLIMVMDVTCRKYTWKQNSYQLLRLIEIPHPEQLCLTIHSTQLGQEDTHELSKNRQHVPRPIIISNDRSFGVPLEIDPETYDFKHIAQFDRKFIIFLWNKTTQKLEIYFEITARLKKVLKEQTTLKKLSPSKNFMISVNEPKGLIAIYDNEKGRLDACSFDEERTNLHLQFCNILLQQWYPNIPEISHFFFIKNTEDICFVERNGRARIYNLTNNNFRPGIAQLPANSSRVLSTPDGACIVAFVKEIIHSEETKILANVTDCPRDITSIPENVTDCPRELQISSEISKESEDKKETTEIITTSETRVMDDSITDTQPDDPKENLTDGVEKTETEEVVRAYIFFSENFTPNASMIIDVPLKNPSVELFQFSSFEMQQIHLTTIDQHDGSFQSLVTNISHAKTKYRFEKLSVEKTVGSVKIESHDPFTVHGQNTNFTNDINVRDSLVIETTEIITTSETRVMDDSITDTQPDDPKENLTDGVEKTETEEVVRAYIFFSENFTPNASMIIDVPLKNPSVELFQFSSFEMQQIHLTTIDQHDGSFQSLVTNISHAKTKYRFEKLSVEKTVGSVKIESHDPFTVHGQNTNFTNDINVRDSLVIGNEKRQIIEVISNNELRISNKSFESLEHGKWIKFVIEPRTTTNGLLDVYSMVFTKYAIASPIGRTDSPLTLTVVMDLNSNELEIDEYEKKFQKYIKKSFEKFRNDTKKPIGHLKEFKSACTTIKDLDLEGKYTEYKFGELDGVSTQEAEQPTLDDGLGLIGSVSKSISFGWYESIFDYYADLKVKSYLLNHCIGSTFDGSARRCTEGVWMSLVRTDDTLYVALDFEGIILMLLIPLKYDLMIPELKVILLLLGLASIERSAQEETFLQLLNAALSNLVLFKSQFAVSRDISSMFQRFQDGSNYFGDDPDIFQACFCIVIKDVPKGDRIDIVDEFHSKFAKIVDKEEEDNFITKLYRDKMCIYPWPVFTDQEFYTKIKSIKNKLDKQESQYENARMFVEKIKVLMTKLKICDWGSIRATLITVRTLELKRFLKDAISYGYEQKEDDSSESSKFGSDPTIKCLMGRDDGIPIPDYDISLSDTFENVDLKLMPDTGLVLLRDGENFLKVSSDLREYFEKHIFARGSIPDFPDSEWISNLGKFFKLIVNRRIRRVQEWFTKNTSRFPKDHNEIYTTSCALDQEISRLNLFWNVCRLRCKNCGLACLKASRHDDDKGDAEHDCLTDHRCHSKCEFKEAHNDGIPECDKFAGHQGKHRCPVKHSCGAPCTYSKKGNCEKSCAKDAGHQEVKGNKIHLCESLKHFCGAPCSLKVKPTKGKPYECRNTCNLPCEFPHTRHECQSVVCPIRCPVGNCQRLCESRDHFHSLEKDVDHFCGNEHPCLELCEEKGVCMIVTEPKKEEAEYVHKDGSFMFTKYTQIHQRLQCCMMIPPYKFDHKEEGNHVHGKAHVCNSECPNDDGNHIKEENKKQKFHYCDQKCPNCAYYCTLPYDHGLKHNTEHFYESDMILFYYRDGSFMFTKYTQIHQRLQCCMMIPPYKFDHKEEGNHVHGKAHVCNSECPNDDGNHIKEENKKQKFHYCDQKCPNCAYYCTLPYDHGLKHNTEHSTVHGNMYLTTFTCEDAEFEFDGHRLNVGDRGDFVLCHKLCEHVGRHRHIDYCLNPSFCESAGGGKREGVLEHMNANISPNPRKKKDYISHRVFWERTNFQDPYSKDDRDNFKKCDYECSDEKHHKVDEYSLKEPTKSYCTLEIFHSSLNTASRPPNGIGYISAGGHHFLCENPATNSGDFHIVFVVDRSSSMNFADCKPLCTRTKTYGLRNSHNNRLGAVYEAVYNFTVTRRNSRAAQNGQMIVDNDTASLVLFANSAICVFENKNEKHHKVDEYSLKEPTKSYCTLEIFHSSLNTASRPPNGIGYISAGGHHFLCENPATNSGDFHIVFVVDRSSSMNFADCKPLCTRTKTYGLRNSHNNRLGAVYEAVYNFTVTRRNSRAAQNGQMIVDNDTASLVLFANSAICVFENKSITNPDELLQIMMTHNTIGGTSFATGINIASTIIQNYYDPLKTNIVIFLSDGGCEAAESEVHSLCSQERTRGSYLYLYTVMFAGDGHSGKSLKRMADIAKEYLPKTRDRQSLTCKYVHAVDEIRLTEYFTSVAESLRRHKPMLIKN
ncbi:hypothetical protein Glove_535g7 [Diversispora epigaea]|uniref:VWFA domain-containing protein n=1 Tax=Diversispora epigaea TaxID=1348612 RepID=A0A397GD83_9GLOM|nr:hypothetical protein Glove_535g7 [Diversispora epigaea]